MESNTVAAVLQGPEHFGNFDIAARPAVTEEERYSICTGRLLVDVVDVQLFKVIDLDAAMELRKLVELGLLSTPVKSIFPISCQTFHIGQRRTVVPSSSRKLVWEGRHGELGLQLLELGVWDIDGIARHSDTGGSV